MATHSSVLAWRISGMGEPGGLPSRGHTESDTTEVTQQQQQLQNREQYVSSWKFTGASGPDQCRQLREQRILMPRSLQQPNTYPSLLVRWFFGTLVHHLLDLLDFQVNARLHLSSPQQLICWFICLSFSKEYELGLCNTHPCCLHPHLICHARVQQMSVE